MSGITKEFLESIGVQMDKQHLELFSEHLNDTLYERIENDIIRSLNHDQIKELGDLRNTGSESVWQWLQTNVPNLREIVQGEVDVILAEIVRSADHI